jgi:hypothetical protein
LYSDTVDFKEIIPEKRGAILNFSYFRPTPENCSSLDIRGMSAFSHFGGRRVR